MTLNATERAADHRAALPLRAFSSQCLDRPTRAAISYNTYEFSTI